MIMRMSKTVCTSQTRRRIVLLLWTAYMCAAILLGTSGISLASSTMTDRDEKKWDEMIDNAEKIIHAVALSGGAIGLGWCGIEYMYASDEAARKAKAKALVILASVAALYLLPYFVRLGISLGKEYGWGGRNFGGSDYYPEGY